MPLGEVHVHMRVIENARALSPPLIKLSSSFRVDLSLASEYHFPPVLVLLGGFVISCSHLYDRWIIPMATAVIMNPLSELPGENSFQENRDPREDLANRETWEHWTDGVRITSCQNYKGWDDWDRKRDKICLISRRARTQTSFFFLHYDVQVNEWAQTCHVSTEGK